MSYNLVHNLAEIARNGGFILCDENSDGGDIRVDWRFIASIDTHRIIKESNFEKLDECIPFLIKSSLNNLLNTRILDPAIAKIFSLSQLSLQYLLFCTRFLDKSVSSLRETLYTCQKQNLELNEAVKERDKELQQIRKKVKRHEFNSLEIYPCTKCTKNFESQLLLESHMLRRHRESKDQDSNLINTIKLELEIKQLKEKLNLTEKELMDSKVVECQKCLENERRSFKNVGIQINYEEKEKDDMEKEDTTEKFREFNENIRKMMADQMQQFQSYKEIDEKRHMQEISDLRDMLDKAVEALKQHEKKSQPLPAPRHTIGIQASSDGSSIKKNVAVDKKEVPQEVNENLWKTRFKELEKMYEDNQQHMEQSMKDMEKAYAEKMVKLEESMRQLKDEKVRSSIRPISTPKDIIPHVYVKKVSSTSSSSDDEVLENIKPIQSVKEVTLQPNLRTFADQKFAISANKTKKTFSAQKWFTTPWNKPKELPVSTVVIKNDQFLKEKAKNMFNDRMKEFDIDKPMTVSKVNEIQSELANRREIQKKKYPHFFIKRKKIKAKVEELFKDYEEKKEFEAVQKVENVQHDEKPKKKVLFNLEEPNKPFIKSNEDSDFDITSLEDDIK